MCSRNDIPPYEPIEGLTDRERFVLDHITSEIETNPNWQDVARREIAEFPIGVPRYKEIEESIPYRNHTDVLEEVNSINPDTVTFPASTGWSKEKADRLQAERLQLKKPNFWPHPEMPPNFYIYPGLEWMLKGWLKDFLEQNTDYEATSEDDSFLYLIEEAKILFQKLS